MSLSPRRAAGYARRTTAGEARSSCYIPRCWIDADSQQRRHQDAIGIELVDHGLHRFARRLEIGYDQRVTSSRYRRDRLDDRSADEGGTFTIGIDHRDNRDALFERAEHCDLSEVGDADERHPIPTASMRGLEHGRAILTGAAEERKRASEVFDGETRFLGKAVRCQIIGIAARRSLTDFQEAFSDAAPQIGVDQAERDPEIGRKLALRLRAVAFDRL